MVNDEERRKVAEELRSESETWRDTFPSATIEEEAFGAAIMSDLMVFVGLDDQSPVHAIYARLADLIDRPTCFDTYNKDSKFFTCGACGFSDSQIVVNPFTLGIRSVKPSYHYCPNCGKEVVE